MSLSERIRPDIEAAPWVCEEVKQMDARIAELTAALKFIEQILAFHEGSESPVDGKGCPVVWINAQPGDGDFQEMLAKVRAALAAVEGK